jgi:hypothetical protein
MNNETNVFLKPFLISLLLTWFFTLLLLNNPAISDDNLILQLLSGIRWALTAIAAGWLAIWGLPRLAAHNERESLKRKARVEEYFKTEIERRIKTLREDEYRRLQYERQNLLDEIKRHHQHTKKKLEETWRKKFHEKLENEFRQKQADGPASAISDFI